MTIVARMYRGRYLPEAALYSGGILPIFISKRTNRPRKDANQTAKISTAIRVSIRTRLSLGKYFSANSSIIKPLLRPLQGDFKHPYVHSCPFSVHLLRISILIGSKIGRKSKEIQRKVLRIPKTPVKIMIGRKRGLCPFFSCVMIA